MGRINKIILNFWPVIFILIFWFIFAFPYLFEHVTVLPTNYLVNFFSPWNAYPGFAGPVKNAAMPDILSQIYPWKELTVDTYKSLQLPLWNPYSFSGTAQLANYQSAVLSPFNLLFFILPFILAWNLLVLLQPLLAGIFMYFYVRTLKVSKISGLVGSLAFMFCGFITTWMGYATLGFAILFLPLALLAVEKFYETRRKIFLVLLSLTFPLSFFSGHFQISLYFALYVFFYLIFKSLISKNFKELIFILSYFAAGLLLTMPQVLPSVESYMQSLRSTIFMKTEIIPWGYLATFLAPDFFGNPVTRNDWFGHYAEWNAYLGLIPLMLGFYALTLVKKSKYVLFFLVASLITILLAFQTPFINLIVLSKIPVLSTSAASRIIVLFSFSFAVLSGFGLDKLSKDLKEKKLKLIFGWILTFAAFFLMLWLTVIFKLFMPLKEIVVARQNLILPTGLFVVLLTYLVVYGVLLRFKKLSWIKYLSFVLMLIVAFDMYRFSVKWMPKDPVKFAYPLVPVVSVTSKLTPNVRFVSNLGQEATTYYRLPSLEGYDAVYNQRYGEFIASLQNGILTESARSVVSFPKNGKFTKLGMDLLGVKYVIHKLADDHASWTFPFWAYRPGDFSILYDDGVYQILQNNAALPRVFLVDRYITQTGPQKILSTMFDKNFNPGREVVLEQKLNQKITSTGSANIVGYTPDKVSVRTNSNGRSLLFLSDNFYPGWNVYIDGKKTDIYRADFSFRAVSVPKGKHLVEFVYFPSSFLLGFWAAVLGFIILIWLNFKRFV